MSIASVSMCLDPNKIVLAMAETTSRYLIGLVLVRNLISDHL